MKMVVSVVLHGLIHFVSYQATMTVKPLEESRQNWKVESWRKEDFATVDLVGGRKIRKGVSRKEKKTLLKLENVIRSC